MAQTVEKKALPVSTRQVLFSHLSKSKHRFLPTAVEGKVEQKGKVYKLLQTLGSLGLHNPLMQQVAWGGPHVFRNSTESP